MTVLTAGDASMAHLDQRQFTSAIILSAHEAFHVSSWPPPLLLGAVLEAIGGSDRCRQRKNSKLAAMDGQPTRPGRQFNIVES
jgi:hypothetical protein